MAPHSAMIRKASKQLGGGRFGHGGGVQRNASAITHNSPTMTTAAMAPAVILARSLEVYARSSSFVIRVHFA